MSIVRLTRVFHFEMSHALLGYDGLCKNIHGHSYELWVTVKGMVQQEAGKEEGMVMDFKNLKQLVNEKVVDIFDHALVLNAGIGSANENALKAITEKLIMFTIQPSCENLVVYFAEKIRESLPVHIKLHHLRLNETASSFAEWYAEDQNL